MNNKLKISSALQWAWQRSAAVMLCMVLVFFGCKEDKNAQKMDEESFVKSLETATVALVNLEQLPEWLIHQIEFYGSDGDIQLQLRVFRGLWNRRVIYFLESFLNNCHYCTVFFENGENIVWIDGGYDFEKFISESKNWTLIYQIEPEYDIKSSYYYYAYQGDFKYEKQYIELNTKYISLTLKEPQLPVDIEQRGFITSEFQRDFFNRWPDYNKNEFLYWTRLDVGKVLTPEKYFELLADIKQKNREIIIGPCFSLLNDTKDTEAFGVGYFFCVKLKTVENITLLEQLTKQTGCVIWQNLDYVSLWFKIGITEDSEMNALECANIFYESGLFQYVDFNLMNVPEEGKTDDFSLTN